jgi:hypothetical protein
MRNTVLLIVLFFSSLLISAQENPVFTSKDMVFYGLDFTKARFTGGFGLTSPATMQDKYMPALNELMIDERQRYNVAKSYKKKNVEYYFNLADEMNSKTDIYDQYVNEKVESLTDEDVQEVINQYKADDKHSGLGLLYIVDEVDHMRSLITVQITFFDIDSGEIYLQKRARGDMRGFSIRNYYAGGIRQIIKDSEDLYPKWKKNND